MGAAIGSSIVCKFDDGEECNPIVLLEVSTDTKVLLNYLVNSFGLTIYLWVKCSGQFLLDS